MEKEEIINDELIEEATGGSDRSRRTNGPITVHCKYCGSDRTYVVRKKLNSQGIEVRVFHCSSCNRDFEQGSGGTLTPVGE